MSVMPFRLQRSRAKGARLVSPNGLPIKYVGRRTKWGNPFFIKPFGSRKWDVFSQLEATDDGEWLLVDCCPTRHDADLRAMELFHNALETGKLKVSCDDVRFELRGFNLACWCKDPPCHAIPLLEIANA
jgi:hypothetical protein